MANLWNLDTEKILRAMEQCPNRDQLFAFCQEVAHHCLMMIAEKSGKTPDEISMLIMNNSSAAEEYRNVLKWYTEQRKGELLQLGFPLKNLG